MAVLRGRRLEEPSSGCVLEPSEEQAGQDTSHAIVVTAKVDDLDGTEKRISGAMMGMVVLVATMMRLDDTSSHIRAGAKAGHLMGVTIADRQEMSLGVKWTITQTHYSSTSSSVSQWAYIQKGGCRQF